MCVVNKHPFYAINRKAKGEQLLGISNDVVFGDSVDDYDSQPCCTEITMVGFHFKHL